ncbi:MAG: hypothetical protein ACOX3A_00810 [bacterium]|jgi:hypothetical protein
MKACVLEDKICINCGKCLYCDLDSNKLCDNCMQCLESDADYKAILIDDILFNIEIPKQPQKKKS